jgi:hypothetical protein
MKKNILTSLLFILAMLLQAQTIDVNGTKMLANENNSFPLWLSSGSSVSPEYPVFSISAIEFSIVESLEGSNMVFSRVLEITETQTVPEGTTWKIESVQTANESFNDSLIVLSQQLDSVLNAPCTALYQVGDMVEGGIVFYVDATGEHGLVAAQEDLEGIYEWGCLGESVDGADSKWIGSGLQNTMDITNQGCATENGGITAAQASLDAEINGYGDWYLPSRDEMFQMYLNIGQGGLNANNNIGDFQNYYYWSSSENDGNDAWSVDFNDGGTTNDGGKSYTVKVRVIRAF